MTEFHADDYGLFIEQSRRILRCWEKGALNGTSIIPNGENLVNCLSMLPDEGLSVTVHLNLMQGHCLADPAEVSLLVDSRGIFSTSFAKLLLCACSGQRGKYKKQLKAELSAQIQAILPFLLKNNLPLRIDGHAHWHMIPVVFDALMEIIKEENLTVSYIRIPEEPLSVYLRNLHRIMPFPPVNIIKTEVLRILSRRNRRKWSNSLSHMRSSVFLGVLLSNCFDLRRMRAVLPAAENLAAKKGCFLEVLAHPGSVHEKEDLEKITNKNDYLFFTSPGREAEADGFLNILSSRM